MEMGRRLTGNWGWRMCQVSYMPDEPRPVFPAELAEKLEGLAGTEILLGSGFEPTMNKNFVQIVRTLTRIGSRIELLTQGTLPAADPLAPLANANVRLLVVSFARALPATSQHLRRLPSHA